MGTKRDEFAAGYLIAVANIMHTHDQPTIALDVLGEAGFKRSVLGDLDLCDFDLTPLNALFDKLEGEGLA